MIRKILKSRKIISPGLNKLFELEENQTSWLTMARKMRNHFTHESNIPRTFFKGGEQSGQVYLKNVISDEILPIDYIVLLEEWHDKMGKLVEELREAY